LYLSRRLENAGICIKVGSENGNRIAMKKLQLSFNEAITGVYAVRPNTVRDCNASQPCPFEISPRRSSQSPGTII